MTTRFLTLLLLFLCCSVLSAQNTLPANPKPPVWSFEVYGGGGVSLLPDATITEVSTGDIFEFLNPEALLVRPGTSSFTRRTNYSTGQHSRLGIEVSRKVGRNWSFTSGIGFDYTTINGVSRIVGSSTIFTGPAIDTLFFEPGGPTESVTICEGELSLDIIDQTNTEFSRFGYVTVPLGARYDLPGLPLRFRAELSVQALAYRRFFGQDLAFEQRENCVAVTLEEMDREPRFSPETFTVRGALGADLRLARALYVGVQVEQQLTSSLEREISMETSSFLTTAQRSSFRPLNLSLVVRYGLTGE